MGLTRDHIYPTNLFQQKKTQIIIFVWVFLCNDEYAHVF